MFQIVERAVPPDIGRLLGGVSLLFTPFGLRGPPANLMGPLTTGPVT